MPNRTIREFVVNGLLAVCCFGLAQLFAAEPTVGEKIQFSDPKDGFQAPLKERDSKLPQPFESLDRQSSISGVMAPELGSAPHAQPNYAPNQRMLELFERRLDEKKNWVYRRSNDATDQIALEEMFGVRGSAASAQDQRTRSVVASFFEGSGNPTPSSHKSESSPDVPDKGVAPLRFDDQRSSDKTGMDSLGAQSGIATDARVLPAGFQSLQAYSIRPVDSLDAAFGGSRSRNRDPLSRSDEFRKLLVIQTGINPLAAGFDPINFSTDATRQELNPTTALGIDTRAGGTGVSDANSEQALNSGRASTPLAGTPTTLGSSSLAPAVSTSVTPSRGSPQPIVLELPRRKF